MAGAYAILALSIGSVIGALVRYGLSLSMNALVPHIPMGTLASNLIAAYIVGVAIAYFGSMPNLSPAWRLLIITGLAGGISTFSTFSAELLTLLREGRLGWSAGMVVLHVGGSLVLTALGMATISLARQSSP
ncbi:TPA: fluoride efflux transporter CrcB [Stenotrophomonas maltophilia]|uniref:fluoride efflux transporter CrcB n=1 Tax=Stenotrophomonas TaxID=40323 RepID=UPI000C14D98D|nr:fluoride efflux transporter CrcB [Stenotrophomonas maltophilia]MBA0373621.1 fluoride efflux transporter CrcB [Stenotrophomonas maltophilia]MBA0543584.1 fluoride efflux transporter CrcB [Stenotrophomonas maltophilia]MBH1718909.1 fluoride efflux transporter CrcB [Stenotrophomonas maltophilia]MBH1793226.1 fluoride efflux transporter CrcB [Stenotrophomonas maltophilia]HEL5400365.1 fluoride efflux transporter CrcB [Stenotrophomonas maltophilia]